MNTYLTAGDIRELHVEVSNLCNASCPMCSRNDHGYDNNKKKLTHWGNFDHNTVFSKELLNLKKVYFCGSHGDPLTFPYLIDAIKHCRDKNISVEIFTNGSLRSLSWWKELVSNLTEHDKIIFGIDGLETNHLYRQNTNIDKILERLKICCKGSVTTQWDFIPFEHNEHELEEAKILSRNLGVNVFRLRKTARFKTDEHAVRNPKTGEITHTLKPPKDLNLRHPDYEKIQLMRVNGLPSQYNINCIYKKNFRIYVNSRLEVLPCSYIGSDLESNKNKKESELEIPLELLTLKKFSWSEILSTNFYTNDLVESFSKKNTISRCIHTCGVVSRILNQNQIVK